MSNALRKRELLPGRLVGLLFFYDDRGQEQGSGSGADVLPQLLLLLRLDGHVQQGECTCVLCLTPCGSCCAGGLSISPAFFFCSFGGFSLRNIRIKYLTVDLLMVSSWETIV